MIGGRDLPSSSFHQLSRMWDHEHMRLQDLLGVFHLRTTLVVQLSMKLDSRRQWPERIRREDEKIEQTQTYDVKIMMMMMMMMMMNEWSHNEDQI